MIVDFGTHIDDGVITPDNDRRSTCWALSGAHTM